MLSLGLTQEWAFHCDRGMQSMDLRCKQQGPDIEDEKQKLLSVHVMLAQKTKVNQCYIQQQTKLHACSKPRQQSPNSCSVYLFLLYMKPKVIKT